MSRSKNGSAVASARGGTGAGGGGGSGPSRFRLVRFPTPGGDLRRGRWLCRDFYERDAVPRGWWRVPASLGSPPAPPLPPSADDTAAPPPPHQPRSLGAFVQLVQQALPPGPPSPRPRGGTAGLSACLGLAGEDSEEEGAGSGVTAIDNKIEQAMDLVKGHVLQAVREEVELLREQIRELRERQVVLERENGALRALATPQQLARLRPPCPHGPPT